MTKRWFDADEWYPVYSYLPPDKDRSYLREGSVELTDEELADFLECTRKFKEWQDRLREKIRGY